MSVAEDAARRIEQAAASPFSWPGDNCLLMLADWIDERRGTALAPRWRALALDERGCRRAMKEAGGMLAFMDREAGAAGLDRIDPAAAAPGDVGLVSVTVRMVPAKRLKDGERETRCRLVALPVGALRLDRLWGLKTRDGALVVPCAALAAWRV